MTPSDKYIDDQYHFKGKWDAPSICGLKVIRKENKTIVIASNLYESNPGTSISRWTAPLANAICVDYKIKPDELVFIERNPDRQSKLDFYKETFDIVRFDIKNGQLEDPDWNRVKQDEVDQMIG